MFDRLISLLSESKEASLLFLRDRLVPVDLNWEDVICSLFKLLLARFSFLGVFIY